MATVLKQIIAPQNLTASLVSYYTVPTNVVTVLRSLTLTNSGTTARTVDIHIVPETGSADTSNIVINDLSIGSEVTIAVTKLVNHVLNEADEIYIGQDAGTDIVVVASGAEVS